MALTLEDAVKTKQRCRAETRSPGASLILKALFMHLATNLNNIQLQFTAVAGLNSADVVGADVACKVYCVYGKKPTASTTDAWLKASDHATTAAANGDFVAKYLGTGGGGQEHAIAYMDGLKMGTGFTLGSHTTVNGNTKSNVADAPTGFVIVGAA